MRTPKLEYGVDGNPIWPDWATMAEVEKKGWDPLIEDHFRQTVSKTRRAGKREGEDKKDAFAVVPLTWAADIAKAMRAPDAMLLVLLAHMVWKTKNTAFPLPNGRMEQYGVSRQTKRRALAQLEKAGAIQIQRRGNMAMTITLRGWPRPL